MTEPTEFGGVRLVIATGWYDITDDLGGDSPPTLARNDGVGVLQFSAASYQRGSLPTSGARELAEMLEGFARARGLAPPNNVRTENDARRLIVSGDFENESDLIRAWYVTDARNVAFITYVSHAAKSDQTRDELRAADAMVRSIRECLTSTGDRHVVVLAGWNHGLRTIDLIKLVRERTSLNLAEAKAAVERVIDGEEVLLVFGTGEEAQRFLEDAAGTGVIGRLGS